MTLLRTLSFVMVFLLEVNVWAYEIDTHRDMTSWTIELSDLKTNVDLLPSLGLPNYLLDTNDSRKKRYANTKSYRRKNITELFLDGTEFEDDGNRALNHFYDPANDRPLTAGFPLGVRSPDWALEKSADYSLQEFSYRTAQDDFYGALVNKGELNRRESFERMFQTLGQVIHHIQDMAQPQHVRNDAHCNGEIEGVECYGLHNPSFYEEYTNREEVRSTLPLSGYPAVQLPLPKDYWHTENARGIADYTNRNFVSQGTNFRALGLLGVKEDSDYDYPQYNSEIWENVEIADLVDTNLEGVITFYGTETRDRYLGEAIELNLRAVTLSHFDKYLRKYGHGNPAFEFTRAFTLNEFNFKSGYGFLIPRAVGYGAGLINHFFRGELELTLSEAGVYSMLDHAVEHTRAVDGLTRSESGRIFGFEKLRVGVRNITNPVGETGQPTASEPIPQELLGGELRAVVKYQLNYCYEPDLSGEMPLSQVTKPIPEFRTLTGCTGVEYITGDPGYAPRDLAKALTQQEFERISVSKPIGVGESGDIQIGHDVPVEIEFDFTNDPIPVNAREVYLQVVYRGKLGPDDDPSKVEEDAVVVATKDISEPTFLTIINGTDYFRLDEKFYTKEEIDSNPDLSDRLDLVIEDEAIPGGRDKILEPRELREVKFGQGSTAWASVNRLPAGRFSRVAVLADTGDLDWTAQWFWSPYDVSFPDTPFQGGHVTDATLSQYKQDGNQYDFEYYKLRRGVATHYEYASPQWHVVFDDRGENNLRALERDSRFSELPEFEVRTPWPITCDFMGVVRNCEEG